MSYKNSLIKSLNQGVKKGQDLKRQFQIDPAITDMMTDPRYLRQSSALVNEALQKGYDVLQLANGDIVTTGTRTIVYHYEWNGQHGKLVKTKTETSSQPARRQMMEESDADFNDADLDTAVASAADGDIKESN